MEEPQITFGILTLVAVACLSVGLLAGYFFKREDLRKRQLELDATNEKKIREAEGKVHEAEKKARELEHSAENRSKDIVAQAKDEANKIESEIKQKVAKLEQREEILESKHKDFDQQKIKLEERMEQLEQKENKLEEIYLQETEKLEAIAKMSRDEAEKRLLDIIEKNKEERLLSRMKKADKEIEETLEEKAREKIVRAIQKYASDVTSESTQTIVNLPDDEMKGRIIGREGRNINAFERYTGVDVIVDDTPGVVIISGFDLLRRFIAKKSMESLIEDGRIHPARIEEVVQKTTKEVDKMLKQFGQKAVDELGISIVAPELIKILGRLRFRTSYGQNVLKHSVEVAFLAEELANQVGADPEKAKMAGLFHDIGKSVSEEVGGKHALISAEIARKFRLEEDVINAIEAHHDDVDKTSDIAYIVQAADAISASRPGARRDTTEKYIRRLKKQEEIVNGFEGVKNTFMMNAGRDMWVFVDPEKVSDLEAKKMSEEIAKTLENDMTYPGEIKVVVLRELRAESIAH